MSSENLQSIQPRMTRGKTPQQKLLALNSRSQGRPGTKPQEILGTGRTELPHGCHKTWFERGQRQGRGGDRRVHLLQPQPGHGSRGTARGSVPSTALARLESSGSHFLPLPPPRVTEPIPSSPRGGGRGVPRKPRSDRGFLSSPGKAVTTGAQLKGSQGGLRNHRKSQGLGKVFPSPERIPPRRIPPLTCPAGIGASGSGEPQTSPCARGEANLPLPSLPQGLYLQRTPPGSSPRGVRG